MIKRIKAALASAVLVFALLGNSVLAAETLVNIKVNNPGIDIYTPIEGIQYGYYYGPSIIINPDKSIDIWGSSVPDGVGWDSIRWIHSGDGGKTWTKPVVALKPTAMKEDNYSTCDPGVVKFGGYYYIGYTSTLLADGTPNNVYVARSKNPAGPFEKWNGNGWGGDPKALTGFIGDSAYGGASMPCFLVKNNKIYMYYTYQAGENDNGQKLSIGDATNPNWPATLKDQGYIKVPTGLTPPSDIKYCDKLGKFVGLVVENMLKWDAAILVYESSDGINFKKGNKITYDDNIMPYNHNAGISGTPEGHLDLNIQNFVGYAYIPDGGDQQWGHWATRFAPITITNAAASSSSSSSKPASSSVKSSAAASSASSSQVLSTVSSTASSGEQSVSTSIESSTSGVTSGSSSTVSQISGSNSSEAVDGPHQEMPKTNLIIILCAAAAVVIAGAIALIWFFRMKKKS